MSKDKDYSDCSDKFNAELDRDDEQQEENDDE